MKITKAIISLAGFGTRFLPVTKAMPKEMLPVVDKPIVQYLVEEAVAAGITDIILVTRYGNRAIEDHFDSNSELEHLLEQQGKTDKLKMVKEIAQMANFIYVRQKSHLPYGNASPLLAAKSLIDDDESFVYMYGDDLVKSKVSCTKQLIDKYNEGGIDGINAVQRMPREVLNRYGTVKLKEGGIENQLDYFVEKPAAGEEPSDMVSFGRFVLSYKIFDYLDPKNLGKDNELWMVDAVTQMAKDSVVLAQPFEGKWLTTGDPVNYLQATIEFALDHPKINGEFKQFLRELHI